MEIDKTALSIERDVAASAYLTNLNSTLRPPLAAGECVDLIISVKSQQRKLINSWWNWSRVVRGCSYPSPSPHHHHPASSEHSFYSLSQTKKNSPKYSSILFNFSLESSKNKYYFVCTKWIANFFYLFQICNDHHGDKI